MKNGPVPFFRPNVVGATTYNILSLFYKDFSYLVLLAALLASPLTYLIIDDWLSGFAYRINIDWIMLGLPEFFVFIIALLTVSYQAIKAALLNPVDSLKYE